MFWRGDIPPPGRFWRFEADHPLVASLILGTPGAVLFGLLSGWPIGLAWFIAAVLLGILGWRPGGVRRSRYEAQITASKAADDDSLRRQPPAPPPLPVDRALAVLTAVVSFLGAGWVFLTLGVHMAFGGSLTWGSRDLRGMGLGFGLAALLLLFVAVGFLCIKRRRVGLTLSLGTGILGTVLSGVGLAAGGGAGPLPAAHWWVLLAVALAALVVDVRQAPAS